MMRLMKKDIFTIWLVIILTSQMFVGFDFSFLEILSPIGSSHGATSTVGKNGTQDYSHIQWAIDNASAGDTILVYNGTYNENLIINKSITLMGNASTGTNIRGIGHGNVIYINSSWVNVSGFHINNSGAAESDAGIKLFESNNCKISKNNCSKNQNGIYLIDSHNNIINNNTVKMKSVVEGYRNKILLNPVTPDADYQIKIELDKDTFNYSRANGSGNDVRFYDINGSKLNYWIEKWNSKGTSIIWVNIPLKGTSELYMLYGDGNANPESDGNKTFDFFDDFSGNSLNQNKWTVSEFAAGTHSYQVSGGELHVYAKSNNLPSGYRFISKKKFNTENFTVFSKGRWTNLDWDRGGGSMQSLRLLDNDGDYTGLSICLWGDFKVTIGHSKDANQKILNNPNDFASGTAEFNYIVKGNIFSEKLSGTYSPSFGDTIQTFNRPFQITLDAFMDHWTQDVEMDSYYDIVIMRKYSASEPKATIINSTMVDTECKNGILMESCGNNTFSGNKLNGTGFIITGPSLEHWNSHTMDSSNKINDKPLCYRKNEISGSISNSNGQVILANCSKITIYDQNITNCTIPVLLGFSDNNTIRNNSCGWGKYGIYIFNGDYNAVKYNDCNNNVQGININNGEKNDIMYNNFTNNEYGMVIDNGGNNTIKQNYCVSNHTGIRIESSYGNNVSDNECNSNKQQGILLNNSNGNKLVNNTCSNNTYAIHICNSTNNTIEYNNCSNNEEGIRLVSSEKNTIRKNLCGSNTAFGIYLNLSENNSITNNTCSNNTRGIFLYKGNYSIIDNNTFTDNERGIHIWKSSNNSIENNNCSDNVEGIRLVTSEENIIRENLCDSSIDFGIYLASGGKNKITNNTCSNNTRGIFLYKESYSNLYNNTCANNNYGIFLHDSSDNNLYNNTGSKNSAGIFLEYGGNNSIRNNTYEFLSEDGIKIFQSNNNSIIDNNCSDCTNGISVYSSRFNKINNNNLKNNTNGILLYGSPAHNDFNGNVIIKTDAQYGFYFSGEGAYDNTVNSSNVVNNIPIRWYGHERGISLNGLVISGRGSTNVGQIILYDCHDVNLTNSTITDGVIGIYLKDSSDNLLKNNNITGNTNGIHLNNSNNNTIASNNVTDNDLGIYLLLGGHNLLANNNVSDNEYGIYLNKSLKNSISFNSGVNSTYGIFMESSELNNISNNTLNSNHKDAIHLYHSDNNSLANNTCNGNRNNGIHLDISKYNSIRNNNFSNNTNGISISPASNNNSITGNIVEMNKKSGIYLDFSFNNTIVENNVTKNRCGVFLNQSIIIFMDDFEDGTLAPWSKSGVGVAGVSDHTANSGSKSMYTRGGSLYCTSPVLDLSRYDFATINCWIRRGSDAFSENPDNGDDLKVQYKDSGSSWKDLVQYLGNGVPGQIYKPTFHLPAGALHSSFQMRLYQTDGSGRTDYWHIDDVYIIARTYSNNNIIRHNTLNTNEQGIWVNGSGGNIIEHNKIFSNNDRMGICIQSALNNTVRYNHLYDLTQGLYINSSSNNSISYNNITSNNGYGIHVSLSDNNSINNNTLSSNNGYGIFLNTSSKNNIIHYNIFSENKNYGVYIEQNAVNNVIHHNNFIANIGERVQAFDRSNNNKWNNNLGEGNFWSDYSSRYPLATHNGVTWDIAYSVDGGMGVKDEHPLVFITFVDDISPTFVTDRTWKNATTGDIFNFSATVIDNIAVVNVWVNYTINGRIFHNISLVHHDNDIWYNNTVLLENATNLTYHFSVLDAGRNWKRVHGSNILVNDNDAPELILDNSMNSATTGDRYEITADFADNIRVDFVLINYTFDGIQFHNESLFDMETMQWNKTLDIPSWATFFTYYFYFGDAAGNRNITDARNITVTDNDLPILLKDNTPETSTTGEDFLFSAEFTDNINISSVWINYAFDSQDFFNVPLNNINSTLWTFKIRINSRATNLTYFFNFEDKANNKNTTLSKILLVRDNDVPIFLSDQTSQLAVTSESFTFILMVADNIGVTSASVNYTFDNSTFYRQSMYKQNELSWNSTIEISSSAVYLEYIFHISDNAPNFNTCPPRRIDVHDNEFPVLIKDNISTVPTTGDTFTFSVLLEDNVGIFSAIANYTTDGIEYHRLFLYHEKGNEWIGTITIEMNSTMMGYHFQFSDFSGNLITSSSTVRDVTDNDAPFPDAGENIRMKKGENVVFNGTNSRDNIGILNYTWSFSYNNTTVRLFDPTPSFIFLREGNYTVKLTVEDLAGNCAIDFVDISINSTGKEEPIPHDDMPDDDPDDEIPGVTDDGGGRRTDPVSTVPLWISIPLNLIALLVVGLVLLIFIKKRRKAQDLSSDVKKDSQKMTKNEAGGGTEGEKYPHEIDISAESLEDMDKQFRDIPHPPAGTGKERNTIPGGGPYPQPLMRAAMDETSKLGTGRVDEHIKALPETAGITIDVAWDEGNRKKEENKREGPRKLPSIGPPGPVTSNSIPGVEAVPFIPPEHLTEHKGLRGPSPEMNTVIPGAIQTQPIITSTPLRMDIKPVLTKPLPPPPDFRPPEEDTPQIFSEEEIDRPTMFSPSLRKKPSYLSIKRSMLFKMEDSMPCSICYGDISAGLQAIRCPCGDISHLTCGIQIGRCSECGVDYQDIVTRVSQEAIIKSIEDSKKTAKREVGVKVDWDDTDDMMKQLLKKVINKEITVEEYKMLSNDLKNIQ